MRQVKWVSSGGGPLLCLTDSQIMQWLGPEGKSHDDAFSSFSDYEWICEIPKGYISIFPYVGHPAIILSEPMMSTWVQHSEDEGFICRIYGCDSNYPDIIEAPSWTIRDSGLLEQDDIIDQICEEFYGRDNADNTDSTLYREKLMNWIASEEAQQTVVVTAGEMNLFDPASPGSEVTSGIHFSLQLGTYLARSGFSKSYMGHRFLLHWFSRI